MTILVVDDDHASRDLLDAYLKRAGFQVITAKDGTEAVAIVMWELPQLIVLDILMPGMSGLETLRQLKQCDSTKNIPVIITTAGGDVGAAHQCQLTGAATVLTKPFSPAKLLAEINRLLGPG